MVKAVFLDRDGVINANLMRDGKPVAPTTLAEFRILPGVVEAARRLKDAGFLLVIATNQPDVATGRTPKATMEAMHAEIRRLMPIDDFMACIHADTDQCSCRKPKPGLSCKPPPSTALTCLRAHSSAIGGATSSPARQPAAEQSWSIMAICRTGRPCRIIRSSRSRRPPI